ncbi:hypothetical protein F4780DRAFT_493994 [Xylariomycetidae sp. FL0641]|nr:hypothetical protein F4780DRAFT_493994 [Xylariomycetidae sp. FL0641]
METASRHLRIYLHTPQRQRHVRTLQSPRPPRAQKRHLRGRLRPHLRPPAALGLEPTSRERLLRQRPRPRLRRPCGSRGPHRHAGSGRGLPSRLHVGGREGAGARARPVTGGVVRSGPHHGAPAEEGRLPLRARARARADLPLRPRGAPRAPDAAPGQPGAPTGGPALAARTRRARPRRPALVSGGCVDGAAGSGDVSAPGARRVVPHRPGDRSRPGGLRGVAARTGTAVQVPGALLPGGPPRREVAALHEPSLGGAGVGPFRKRVRPGGYGKGGVVAHDADEYTGRASKKIATPRRRAAVTVSGFP